MANSIKVNVIKSNTVGGTAELSAADAQVRWLIAEHITGIFPTPDNRATIMYYDPAFAFTEEIRVTQAASDISTSLNA